MIQAKLLGMILSAILKHPKIMELFKYKDEPNELDVAVKDLEQKITDVGFKLTASIDMIKGYAEAIDIVSDKVKSIDKVINKFDNKLRQIDKIAHPPAMPLKEINEFKDSVKNVKWMMSVFNNMKKLPLLKSVFK